MNKIDFKNVHTMIGADAVVFGDIELQEGLIIYGTVHGSIRTKGPIRISMTGNIKGDVFASDIHLEGEVNGNITVEDRAVLGSRSKLKGDLIYRKLLIEEGAQFEGKCDLNVGRKEADGSPV